ncbi:hypothetical protein LCGC14_2091550 [marine sediment metagenome]|uniref:Uncharacterized protein n=1 Tax=marine sediment metagenome TaxID=412755 RepID=A0A0F9GQQ8_9ZZZZ
MTRAIHKLVISAAILLSISAISAMAFASSGGEGGGSVWPGFLIQVLNFAVILGVIVWFGRKPIKEFFAGRTEAISKGIADAREAREFAEKALSEIQQKLDTSDQEIEKMVKAARKAGERERDHLISEGERLSSRIMEQAKAGIDFELKQASEGLKAEAAEYALKIAEASIGRKLDAGEQNKLLEDAISRLEDRA